ncbi:MAG: DNA polymerase III subunit beta [Rickettsiaceae bacterium]|nr:MAG: DNA polymerase III subunit beta [Rickettsiaceae bacterium]
MSQEHNKKLDIIIETKELAHALFFANSIVERRNVMSELSNIKLSVENNLLEIVAADTEMMLSQKIGANVHGEGMITVSTILLIDIAKKIPDKEIKLTASDDSKVLEVIGQTCNFSLCTLPVVQFPSMENIKTEVSLKIPCREFSKIIEHTQFSISSEETRYHLNGIYLHIEENKLIAAATDGHRLSVSKLSLNSNTKEFGVILPRKTIIEIFKIVKDLKNINLDIEIFLSTTKVKFVCNNIIMISKLIDGTFPEYKAFIPANSHNIFTVNSKHLQEAIGRVAIVTADKFRAIKISLSRDEVQITASGEARGVAKETLNYSEEKACFCSYLGETNIVAGFNPQYILEVLNVLKNEIVEFHFDSSDSTSPVLIKVVDRHDDSFVIMPVKV